MRLQLGWILVFIPRPFCPARITVKPTGGEGERQAGATPIFPKKTEEPKKFLPIVTISTISGTGTDMDCLGIVNNIETREKTFFGNPALYPAASFLDPTETFTVSPYQTACGAIDAFIHYLEVYFMRPNLYRMRRKTPPFRAGDIRRVRRICVSN